MRLRDAHYRAAESLARGASIELAAMRVGVHPNTVRRWRRSPVFGQIEAAARDAVREEEERAPASTRREDIALQAHEELLLLARTAPDQRTRLDALRAYVEHAVGVAMIQARRDVGAALAEVIQTLPRKGA